MSNKVGSKILQGQSRQVVYNVYKHMLSLKPDSIGLITELKQQVAQATGVSMRTLERIVKEGRELENKNAPVVFNTPGLKRSRVSAVTTLQDFEKDDLRTIIYNCYKMDSCPITISLLRQKLAEELGWGGSATSLRVILRKMGFRWKQAQGNKRLLIEKSDLRALRIGYLQTVQYHREQGRSMVYLCGENDLGEGSRLTKDVTPRLIVLHAGRAEGFLPGCACVFSTGTKSGHREMNTTNYEQWLNDRLIPNLPQNSVVVVGNTFYNNVSLNPTPTSDSKKIDMIDWLSEKNITFAPGMLKPQLYELIKQHRHQHVSFKLDFILREHGHVVLRLPPHHLDLNPMEMVLGGIKKRVAEKTTSFAADDVQMRTLLEFETVEVQEWRAIWETVVQNEVDYLTNERFIDEQTEKLVQSEAGEGNGDSEDDSDDVEMSNSDDE